MFRGVVKFFVFVDVGVFFVWLGNIIYWGSVCEIDSLDLLCMSVVFVFCRCGCVEV